jgi:hypothetical protein
MSTHELLGHGCWCLVYLGLHWGLVLVDRPIVDLLEDRGAPLVVVPSLLLVSEAEENSDGDES